jgi:predicted DCC family thiol-disulfide oxidoreductase YuxK
VRVARAGAIKFRDINLEPNALALFGEGRRLYGMEAEGRLHIGADCALEIWRHTPGDVWLGNLLGLPVLRQITRFGYDRFADLLASTRTSAPTTCNSIASDDDSRMLRSGAIISSGV